MKSFIFLLVILMAGGVWAKDHSKYIKGPFKTPQDVTKECLACHKNSAKEVMKTTHWTWDTPPVHVPGHQGLHRLGKRQLFNNYCINVQSNWPRCTSCHVGYGWKDKNFDFNDQKNVDCLICHADPKVYKKNPKGAGLPMPNVDLLAAAKSVRLPNRENCGSCHFYGGGGENVKHGDLESLLIHPSAAEDVHMGGQDMVCQDCHTTDHHQIKGKGSSVSVADTSNALKCEDCHGSAPHDNSVLNLHVRSIACQTCHIPTFAKGIATKTWWDWSKAGKDIDPKNIKKEYGRPTYNKMKGAFHWGKNLRPEYAWYNGKFERYLMGDKFDPGKVLYLNKPMGSIRDSSAKIYPFKIMRGKQIYDSKYNYLIVPHLWQGYWKYFDWDRAAREGMKVAGLPYSGHYGFVETKMYWRINHEVVPKEQALKCMDCHGKKGIMDWKALGYKGDPMFMGSRKKEGFINQFMETDQ